MTLLVLTGLREDILYFLSAYVCSPISARFALRWSRSYLLVESRVGRAATAVFLVTLINSLLGFVLIWPRATSLGVFVAALVPAPIAVALVLGIARVRRRE